jgi:hypothetical protein
MLDKCESCNGTGEVAHHVCPNVMAREMNGVMRSYLDFDQRGQMPVVGTMRDQSNWWQHAVRLIERERHVLEEEQRAVRERASKVVSNHG